jgi:hypothetical protein
VELLGERNILRTVSAGVPAVHVHCQALPSSLRLSQVLMSVQAVGSAKNQVEGTVLCLQHGPVQL